MKGSQIAVIGGGIAAAVIISIFLVLGESQNENISTESQNEVAPIEEKFLVYTTFYPLQQFTQNIAGDAADVKGLIPSNGDPHAFEIGPKTIVDLSKADMLVYNGVDFEPYIDEIKSSPDFSHLIFVDSSEGITLLEGEKHDDVHEEENEIDYVNDPHIWLDPLLVKKQVMNIAFHMAESDPENSETYLSNAKSYSDQLDALDQEIKTQLSICKKDTFVPFHNAFSYFAERYNLHTLAVIQEFSPDTPVTAKDIEELIHFAEDNDIKYFFTEENRNAKLAERLASELGGDILLFSPLESLTEQDSPDTTYFDKMRANVDNLKIALECS